MRHRLTGIVAASALVAIPLTAAPPAAAEPTPDLTAAHHRATALAKGPIGWDVYRRLDRTGELRTGAQSRQFSSFDRTGGNNDGFAGTYSCLRQDATGCVIAEHTGAGEIGSIWFTRDYGVVRNTGKITIELDGGTVLDAQLQDVVDGRLGAPWVWPLVGNGDDTAGGSVIKVPMPYRRSMRITVQHNPLFHHVGYRTFADAAGVPAFDPGDRALDVIETLRGFGIRDPKPAAPGTVTRRGTVRVGAGDRARLAVVRGPGRLTALRLKLPQVARAPRVTDDGRAFTGRSTFKIAVDPANTGVRVTRRIDPSIGDQRVRLLVDGRPAGESSSGPAKPSGSWADQTIEIPAALTAGKRRLTLTNEFVSSPLDANEFRYDIASKVDGQWTRTDVVDVGPGHPGEESAHEYTLDRQNWQGTRTFRYPVDPGEVARSDAVLADARLNITFDGRTTVDAPLGEFFGSGLGEYDTRSLLFSMDPGSDGWYSAWWPMPFAQEAVVRLVNRSGVAIEGGTVEVRSVQDPSVAPRLRPGGDLGYFHATARRGHTEQDRDWIFLDAQGRGVFYGVTHSMRGLIPAGNRRNYLEGDERVYVDGALSPTWHGTGTEDFYESGWYFRDGTTYAMPLAGNPAYELDGDGCRYDCTGAYRLLVTDPVPFGSSLRFGVEHGPLSNEPGDYGSTAYWYGTPMYELTRTDAVDVAEETSRVAHEYTAPDETRSTLTSTFEGEDDGFPVRRGVTAARGPVGFRMKVDRGNRGIRLTRLGDQAAAYQAADVQVDGRLVGRWSQPLGNDSARWLEDAFEIPGAFTAGKPWISIRLAPVPGAPPWSASRYETLSRVAPFSDQRPPGAVTGLRATGGEDNTISVDWAPARDDVGVARYQVYAARDPSVPTRDDTLVAEPSVTGFRHTGLGVREGWYYRVRAVDGTGRTGPASAVTTATTGDTVVVEGESLLPPVSADEPAEAQGNCCEVVWSGNAQLWFRATAAGSKVIANLTVPTDGAYDISAVYTKARDYGITKLAIDDTILGQPFDGFHSPEVVIAPPVTYPGVRLTRGSHRLTLTVTGKNPASTGFFAGIDLLRMKLRS